MATTNSRGVMCNTVLSSSTAADATCANSKDANRQILCTCGIVDSSTEGQCTTWVDPATAPSECAAGYTENADATCVECEAGKYKTGTGSDACTACPTNSNSPAASSALSACTCPAGYTGPDGEACSECGAGKYKTGAGSDACTDCSAGKYKASQSTELCSGCSLGTYSAASGATECTACPTGSTSPAASSASSACTCIAGYTGPDNSQCTECSAGKFKAAVGMAECTVCAAGSYAASGALRCTACSDGKTTDEGHGRDESDCACSRGNELVVETQLCVSCVTGELFRIHITFTSTLDSLTMFARDRTRLRIRIIV